MRFALVALLAIASIGCAKRELGMTGTVDHGDHGPQVCRGFGLPAPRAFDVIDRRGHAKQSPDMIGCFFNHYVCPGEMYYTLQPGENLYQVAALAKVDLAWLIKRNTIDDDRYVRPGLQLIVPRMAHPNP